MQNQFTLTANSRPARILTAILAIGAAVALPQVFHAVGVLSGTGAQLGSALLPMHLPVLLAGFLGGPVTGCIAGILSPLVSFGISGMPDAALVPFMMIELGAYGLTAGMLSGTRLNSFCKLLIAQIAGRATRAAAVLVSIHLLGNTALAPAAAFTFITAGLFGILLQWALIPLLLDRLEGMQKHDS